MHMYMSMTVYTFVTHDCTPTTQCPLLALDMFSTFNSILLHCFMFGYYAVTCISDVTFPLTWIEVVYI